MKRLTWLVLFLIPICGYAEDAVPSGLEGVLAALSAFVKQIPGEGWGAAVIVGLVLETILRLFKSERPRSILIAVANLLMLVSEICRKASVLLNKVIPQRVVTPKLEGPGK